MPRRRDPNPRVVHGRPPVGTSVYALLGPTNTGKTHRAIERMLEHPSGVLGLPLRLLAREVYDRLLSRVPAGELALITGEEKLVPPRARYFICTVEAMPLDREVDFLAVDEVQLAAHPERGHTFTDRILYRRGRVETWLLGSGAVEAIVRELVPTAVIQRHPRLSVLRGAGQSTLGELAPRSAVVAFSATRVYELAERVRRRRGGAAVVLGALSPRARNAQVALYQSGDVGFLVATDAIGMGLNLNIAHVAFAERAKFDGAVRRPLEVGELAQIAGRAGRYTTDGSFGTLKPEPALPPRLATLLTFHQVPPERQIMWRSPALDCSSLDALLSSLATPSPHPLLRRVVAEDHKALLRLAEHESVRRVATSPERVSLLWQVAQIPDYRHLLFEQHLALGLEIYRQLIAPSGRLEPDWLSQQVRRLDDVRGDLDALLARMAAIRTFTYITHQAARVDDAAHWQAETRAVEDRLSDALHQALVARFVDHDRVYVSFTDDATPTANPAAESRAPRPPSPLSRPQVLTSARARPVDAGHPFAALADLRRGLHGTTPPSAPGLEERLLTANDQALDIRADGTLTFEGQAVARLTRQRSLVTPGVALVHPALENTSQRHRIQERLTQLLRTHTQAAFGALWQAEPQLELPARGLIYQLTEELGVVEAPRSHRQRAAMSHQGLRALKDLGVAFGARYIYLQALNGAAGLTLRRALLSVSDVHLPATFTARPAHPKESKVRPQTYQRLGYPLFAGYAIRVDLHDRLAARLSQAHYDPKSARLQRELQRLRLPQEELARLISNQRLVVRHPGRRPRRRAGD